MRLSSTGLTIYAVLFGLALIVAAQYVVNKDAVASAELTVQRPDVSTRHIYGSSRAGTVIVEFSDYQCPYCARVHGTIKRLVDESNGTIAWEYRHLPLQSHPLAKPGAILAECLASNVGGPAFWEFTDTIFSEQNKVSGEYLESLATELGLTAEEIEECKADESIAALVTNDEKTATALGGSGTPFSVVLFPDNSYKTVSGAVPYEDWQNVLSAYNE